MAILEQLHWNVLWTIERYNEGESQPYDVSEIKGNLLLNEGIQLMEDLLIGEAGTDYASAYVGVGDSSAAVAATQTALQAASNKVWVACDAGYPSRTDQTITFKATFGSAVGNFAWNEFTITNGADDTGTNLNRKVSSQGTKSSGQTWVVTMAVTIS